MASYISEIVAYKSNMLLRAYSLKCSPIENWQLHFQNSIKCQKYLLSLQGLNSFFSEYKISFLSDTLHLPVCSVPSCQKIVSYDTAKGPAVILHLSAMRQIRHSLAGHVSQ